MTLVNRPIEPSLEAFSNSINGVTGGIAVPFASVSHTVLEDFLGIGVREEVGPHQRLVDGHKVDGAENGTEIVTDAFVKLFAGFKQLNTNATWRQAFLGAVGDNAVV